MIVKHVEGKLWEVHDGAKWYTAALTPDGWYVMSADGRVISNTGKLGKRIIEAMAWATPESIRLK